MMELEDVLAVALLVTIILCSTAIAYMFWQEDVIADQRVQIAELSCDKLFVQTRGVGYKELYDVTSGSWVGCSAGKVVIGVTP